MFRVFTIHDDVLIIIRVHFISTHSIVLRYEHKEQNNVTKLINVMVTTELFINY